jgi:hypothetical protein
MRNIIIFIILTFIIIEGIISFFTNNKVYKRDVIIRDLPKVTKMSDVYNKDSSNIKSLLIRNGNTGETKVTEDSLKIREFFDIMQDITFIKAKNQNAAGRRQEGQIHSTI